MQVQVAPAAARSVHSCTLLSIPRPRRLGTWLLSALQVMQMQYEWVRPGRPLAPVAALLASREFPGFPAGAGAPALGGRGEGREEGETREGPAGQLSHVARGSAF